METDGEISLWYYPFHSSWLIFILIIWNSFNGGHDEDKSLKICFVSEHHNSYNLQAFHPKLRGQSGLAIYEPPDFALKFLSSLSFGLIIASVCMKITKIWLQCWTWREKLLEGKSYKQKTYLEWIDVSVFTKQNVEPFWKACERAQFQKNTDVVIKIPSC